MCVSVPNYNILIVWILLIEFTHMVLKLEMLLACIIRCFTLFPLHVQLFKITILYSCTNVINEVIM